jgi:predicted transcriptional regulator
MSQDGPADLDKVFKALGNVTRRRILQLLAQGARYPYQLSKTLGLTQRGVFKHLEALQEAGLVERYHGESELGPDRVYYRLNARLGLSTTILPDVFTIRLTTRQSPSAILIPKGFIIPEARPDVAAVRKLLRELGKVNRKLMEIDEERLRFASLRGKIISKIEEIMDLAEWDEESCQKVRSLIDPIKHQAEDTELEAHEIWADTVKQTLRLFENLLHTHGDSISDKEKKENELDEEFELNPD